MGFRQMRAEAKIATAAYREQLAMEKMVVRKNPASSLHGKDTFDVVWPKAYEKSIDSAGNRLRWFNAQLKSGATQMVNWGKNTQWAGRQLMVGFTMPIAAFGAAAGVMAYQVDKEFTRIAKVYDTTANKLTDLAGWEAETAELRAQGYDTARLAAREYQAAITDTLKVQGELAATGIVGTELQKMTAEIMRISTLGEIDPGQTTDAAIALRQVWGQTADEAENTFNYINALENATSLTADDFTIAMPVASAAVKAFGGDIQELGTLMTAMRERGIQASEGANALKATMQRLSRPSKQIREEFQALTGESIVELVDSSDGLIEIFTKLNTVTTDLDKNAKRDVFAGLFGSYQVARMTALAEGMGALEEGTGQVSAAARVAGMSTAELAEIAQGEIEALQASVSGRFKAALEEIKIIMAEMGLPFLQAATTILETLAKIGGYINDMPDVAKKFLGWATAIAAVAGPVVMLTGLFANLGGNGLKVLAAMLTGFGKLTGTMNIADKQSRIYSAAAKMAESSHVTQTKAIDSLTATMEKLVAAQVAANTASKNSVATMQQELRWTRAKSEAHKKHLAQLDLERRMYAHYGLEANNGQTILRDPAKGPMASISYANAMKGIQHVGRETDIDKARTAAYAEQARRQAAITASAEAEAKARDRSRVAMLGGSVAAAAMAGSMAAMMLPLGETTNKIAQWTMIGTIVVPAAWTLLRATVATAAAAGNYAKNMAFGAASSKAAAGSLSAGFAGLLTKGNLATAAVAGIGIAAYAVYDHFRDIREEQKRVDAANASLMSQTERWASSTGKVLDGYKKLAVVSKSTADTTDLTKSIEFYKSGEEKESTEAFGDMGYLQKQSVVTGKFIDMVHGMGMSVKDAKHELQAFLMATGETAVGASIQVDQFTSSIMQAGGANFNASDWANQFDDVITGFNDVTSNFNPFDLGGDLEKNLKYLKTLGEQGGQMFAQAFVTGGESQKEELRASLERQVFAPWDDIAKRIRDDASGVNRENLKNMYGLSDADVDEMLSNGEKMRAFYMRLDPEKREGFAIDSGFAEQIEQAEALERILIDGIAKSLGVVGKDVDTLGELFGDAAVAAETLSARIGEGQIYDWDTGEFRATTTEMEQAIAEVGAKYEEVMGKTFNAGDLKEFEAHLTKLQTMDTSNMSDDELKKHEEEKAALEDLITTLYAYARAKNIKTSDSDFGLLVNLMYGLKGETKAATNEVENLDGALDGLPSSKSIKIDIDVTKDIMETAWGAVMDSTADVLNEDFDNRMQASQDRTQAYWDNRQSALDAEMDNRSNALDAKWEKRKDGAEKYWENRIKGIEKAIEAEEKAEEKRQKMFEAEMERLDKLNEAHNLNVDFNVALNEGNLDEAAKIQNDAENEVYQSALSKAAEASANKSEKKVGRLEDRQEDLEAQKDAAMKAMDKREEAEKAHLEKISAMRKKALEADAEAAIKQNEQDWKSKKAAHDAAIELLLSGVARSKEELKTMLEHAGLKYEDFRQVLKNKGQNVNEFINQNLQHEIEKAAIELRSNAAWSELGKGAMNQMITAMGFKSVAQFRQFIKTGEMKDLTDPVDTTPTPTTPGGKQGKGRNESVGGKHEGGWAGRGKSSRKGVARNYKGLHPSEVMLRAKKNEFVVNEKAAAEHGPLLERLNSGKGFPNTKAAARAGRGIGGGGYNYSGVMAGSIMRSLMFGVMKNVEKRANTAKAVAAASGSTGAFPGKYVPGQGGWQKPSIPGLGWTNPHDYRAGEGTPIFAPSDGVVERSHAITSGGSPGNGLYATPYRSYGETIAFRMADGNLMNFGHLMPGGRYVTAGQRVKGGALIGRTGNTGNSSGPHLHMDIGGNENASGYLASRGIALRKGAAEVRFDNTLANLHHGERVLTQDLTQKMDRGMSDYFANGGQTVYDIDINGEGLETKEIVREVMKEIEKKERRKPQSRTIGRKKP